MNNRTLATAFWLPRPLGEVFDFFADAHNLDRITPPWLHFRILTPAPLDMRPGALIEYRLRLRGVPLFWRTRIRVWEPPYRFVDEQVRGPYRLWHHEHTFTSENGGTRVRDTVTYAVPGWCLEPLLHACVVGPDVRAIFAYREQAIRGILAPEPYDSPATPVPQP